MLIEKKVDVDFNGRMKDFNHFFRATGYANADYTYTPAVTRMYDYLSSYNNHPKYMRLHNILTLHGRGDYYKFHEHMDYGNPASSNRATGVDVVVTRNQEGELVYDWSYVDKVYDIMIEHEMKPIVEMVYLPTAIASSFDSIVPANYKEYYEVVREFTIHCTERYGIEEVKTWYFEIINEPENYPIFNQRPEMFMALYDYFEAAVHGVCDAYLAGGPAVKQWEEGKILFERFLEHTSSGVNYLSGGFGTRLDFISVHCKGGRPTMVGPQMNYMFDSLKDYVSILKKYPEYVETPFFNDESDIVWDGNLGTAYKSWLNFRNTEYAPGFVCKMVNTYCDEIQDALGINLAIVDSDNAHLPWEVNLFSGNRSQLTPLYKAPSTDIIRKPFFNAGQMLGRLGNQRLIIKSEDEEFGKKYGCLATKYNNGLGYALMLWNFEDGLDGDVNARRIDLTVTGINKDDYKVVVYRIDKTHSNSYSKWVEMGKPFPLGLDEIRILRDSDSLETSEEVYCFSGTEFKKEVDLPMHSEALILIVKEDEFEKLSFKEATVEEGVLGNKQVYLFWDYSKRVDFVGYRLYKDGKALNKKLISGSNYTDMDVKSGETHLYSVEVIYAYGSQYIDPISVEI